MKSEPQKGILNLSNNTIELWESDWQFCAQNGNTGLSADTTSCSFIIEQFCIKRSLKFGFNCYFYVLLLQYYSNSPKLKAKKKYSDISATFFKESVLPTKKNKILIRPASYCTIQKPNANSSMQKYKSYRSNE